MLPRASLSLNMRILFCLIIWIAPSIAFSATSNTTAVADRVSKDDIERFNNHIAIIKQVLSLKGDEERLSELKSSLLNKINITKSVDSPSADDIVPSGLDPVPSPSPEDREGTKTVPMTSKTILSSIPSLARETHGENPIVDLEMSLPYSPIPIEVKKDKPGLDESEKQANTAANGYSSEYVVSTSEITSPSTSIPASETASPVQKESEKNGNENAINDNILSIIDANQKNQEAANTGKTATTVSPTSNTATVIKVTETITHYIGPSSTTSDVTSSISGPNVTPQEETLQPPEVTPNHDVVTPATPATPPSPPITSQAVQAYTPVPSSSSSISEKKEEVNRLLLEKIERLERIIERMTLRASSSKAENRAETVGVTEIMPLISAPLTSLQDKSVHSTQIESPEPTLQEEKIETVEGKSSSMTKKKDRSKSESVDTASVLELTRDQRNNDLGSSKSSDISNNISTSHVAKEKANADRSRVSDQESSQDNNRPTHSSKKTGKDILNEKAPSYKVSLPPQFQYHNKEPDDVPGKGVSYAKPKKPWNSDWPIDQKPIHGDMNVKNETSGTIGDMSSIGDFSKEHNSQLSSLPVDANDSKDEVIVLDLDQRPDESTVDFLKRIYPDIKKVLDIEPTPNKRPSVSPLSQAESSKGKMDQSNTSYAIKSTDVREMQASRPKTSTQIKAQEDNVYDASNATSGAARGSPAHNDPMQIRHVPPQLLNNAFRTFDSHEQLRSSYLKAQHPSRSQISSPKHTSITEKDSVLMANPFDEQSSHKSQSKPAHKFSPLSKLHVPHHRNHTGLSLDIFGLKLFENTAHRTGCNLASYLAATVMIVFSVIW